MYRHSSKGSSTSTRHYAFPLQRRHALYRLTLVVLALFGLRFLYLHHEYRQALAAKYTATAFPVTIGEQLAERTADGHAHRQRLLNARAQWRLLGAGCEGTAYSFEGQVIKTYEIKSSPFRDCVPTLPVDHQAWLSLNDTSAVRRWPTEIPASLAFGQQAGFVPLSDFFLAETTPGSVPHWHVVSPLAEGGDLRTLAKRVQVFPADQTVRDLDLRFRPRLEEALEALQALHNHGLCHDDIKPSNIFVGESGPDGDGSWLLGDFGNARHLTHPYHTSRIWLHDNDQLPDCRANDARRAMKTYLQFLQAAMAPESNFSVRAAFAEQMFASNDQWARLFWRTYDAGNGVSIQQVLNWSRSEEAPQLATHYVSTFSRKPAGTWTGLVTWALRGKGAVYRHAVNDVLLMTLRANRAARFGLTCVFGLPVQACPAAGP